MKRKLIFPLARFPACILRMSISGNRLTEEAVFKYGPEVHTFIYKHGIEMPEPGSKLPVVNCGEIDLLHVLCVTPNIHYERKPELLWVADALVESPETIGVWTLRTLKDHSLWEELPWPTQH